MAQLKVTSDKAEVVVSLGVDKISYSSTGEILGASPVLETPRSTTVSNGLVEVSEDYNTYIVKPVSAAQTLVIDVTQISGCDFDIVLDFTETVAAVTMPENFEWVGGVTPTMTKKGAYTISVTQLVFEDDVKLLGRCSSVIKVPIDPNKGVVTYIEGTLKEDWCGEEFQDLRISVGSLDDFGDYLNESAVIYVNQGAAVTGNLVVYVQENSDATVNVRGGTIWSLRQDSPWAHFNFSMSGGNIHSASFGADRYTQWSMSGGTIGFLAFEYLGEWESGKEPTLSGGFVQSCMLDGYSSLYVTGGTVGEITITSMYNHLYVSGGHIQAIRNETDDTDIRISLSNCSIGELSHSQQYCAAPELTIGDDVSIDRFTATLNFTDSAVFLSDIGKNCRVEYLDMLSDMDFEEITDGTCLKTISVGANSIVKLSPRAQNWRAKGSVVINADPTAQIINLED